MRSNLCKRALVVLAVVLASTGFVGAPATRALVCVDGIELNSTTMYAFGAGPWTSGGFSGQHLACGGTHYYGFNGSIAGYCGFATGVGGYNDYRINYIWVGALMLSYGYMTGYPNQFQPLRAATHVLVPNAAFGHTCTTVGGASRFFFAGASVELRP